MQNILFKDILEKAQKEFANNNDDKLIAKLYTEYCDELQNLNALTNDNKNAVLKALLRARMSIKEQEIYALNNELENIRKKIKEKEIELYNITKSSFNELNQVVQNDIQKSFLEELMLHEASSLKILYETSQNAFINILESNSMIEERSFLVSNFMLINVLEFAKFDKDKIINAAELILKAALDLANEWQGFAEEFLTGVLNGLLEGIFAILERLKKDFEVSFSDNELNLVSISLVSLESDFIKMLKSNITNDAAGKALGDILNNKLDNNFSKFARLIRENKQILNIKLIKFQNSELNSKIKKELNSLEKEAKKAYNEFDAKKLAQNLMAKFKKN